MTVDDTGPGTKPPGGMSLEALQAICRAARRADCGTCPAMAPEECVYTTGPVSTPVTACTPVRPVRGYHMSRLQRAAGTGLILAAALAAVTAGLTPGAVVWDDGSAPRSAPGPEPLGPFETEREADKVPAVRAIYEATRASTRRGVMGERSHQLLDYACTAAGVELGQYDHRILLWMAGWEPQVCAVVAGLISRANRSSGFTAADLATVRQALADASAWRTWRTEGDRAADTDLAAAYEQLLRRLVTGQEDL